MALKRPPYLKEVGEVVKSAIGEASFNSYCRPHFVAICKLILDNMKGSDSGTDSGATTTGSTSLELVAPNAGNSV